MCGDVLELACVLMVLGLAVCGEGFGLAVFLRVLGLTVCGEGPRVSHVVRARLGLGLWLSGDI